MAGLLAMPVNAATPQPVTSCGNLLQAEAAGSFGTLESGTRDLENPLSGSYSYGNGDISSVGSYVVVSRVNSASIHSYDTIWDGLYGANTGSNNDAYLAVNGATATGVFYQQTIPLLGGESYQLSLFGINAVLGNNYINDPEVGIRLIRESDSLMVASTSTGVLNEVYPNPGESFQGPSDWTQAVINLTAPSTDSYRLEVYNVTTEWDGNDFAIDNISIAPLNESGCPFDYSDAPTASLGGASHRLVPDLYLGGGVNAETADYNTVTADDDVDDGISLFPPLLPGTSSYTLPATNITGRGVGTLHAWIDFDGDGVFEAAEHAAVGFNQGATSDLVFSGYGTTTATGTTYARFRLSTDTLTSADASTTANDGEVEDYAVTISNSLFPSSICSVTLDNVVEFTFDGSNDGVLETGALYAPGSTYRVSHIAPGIDGLVTLNNRISNSMSYLLDGNLGGEVIGTQETMLFDMTLRLVDAGTSTTISTPVDLVLTSLELDGEPGRSYSDGVVFYNADSTFTNAGSQLQPTYYPDHVMYTTRIEARGYNDTTAVDPTYGAGAVYKDVTSIHYGGIVVNNTTNSTRSIIIFGNRTKFDQFTSLTCNPPEGECDQGDCLR
ncbi:MAG: GEVED domain-containing protein [Thiolinea sp.]